MQIYMNRLHENLDSYIFWRRIKLFMTGLLEIHRSQGTYHG